MFLSNLNFDDDAVDDAAASCEWRWIDTLQKEQLLLLSKKRWEMSWLIVIAHTWAASCSAADSSLNNDDGIGEEDDEDDEEEEDDDDPSKSFDMMNMIINF